MKIIRKGYIPTETKTFKCGYCGCIFQAEKSEYRVADQLAYLHDGISADCNCPTCGRVAYCER